MAWQCMIVVVLLAVSCKARVNQGAELREIAPLGVAENNAALALGVGRLIRGGLIEMGYSPELFGVDDQAFSASTWAANFKKSSWAPSNIWSTWRRVASGGSDLYDLGYYDFKVDKVALGSGEAWSLSAEITLELNRAQTEMQLKLWRLSLTDTWRPNDPAQVSEFDGTAFVYDVKNGSALRPRSSPDEQSFKEFDQAAKQGSCPAIQSALAKFPGLGTVNPQAPSAHSRSLLLRTVAIGKVASVQCVYALGGRFLDEGSLSGNPVLAAALSSDPGMLTAVLRMMSQATPTTWIISSPGAHIAWVGQRASSGGVLTDQYSGCWTLKAGTSEGQIFGFSPEYDQLCLNKGRNAFDVQFLQGESMVQSIADLQGPIGSDPTFAFAKRVEALGELTLSLRVGGPRSFILPAPDGSTLLHAFVRRASQPNTSVLKQLRDLGIDPNSHTASVGPVLADAWLAKKPEFVPALIAIGADKGVARQWLKSRLAQVSEEEAQLIRDRQAKFDQLETKQNGMTISIRRGDFDAYRTPATLLDWAKTPEEWSQSSRILEKLQAQARVTALEFGFDLQAGLQEKVDAKRVAALGGGEGTHRAFIRTALIVDLVGHPGDYAHFPADSASLDFLETYMAYAYFLRKEQQVKGLRIELERYAIPSGGGE